MSNLVNQIVEATRSALNYPDKPVQLSAPVLPEFAWDLVKNCLDTNWVSSAGSYINDFEDELAEFTGAQRAVAVVNGTAALQVCLHLVGVQANDEVLCPSLTFAATANAICHCGAQPHFVDIEDERLGIDPQRLNTYLQDIISIQNGQTVNKHTGRPITACIVMHCFGHPALTEEIKQVLNEYDIPLVEDAAESLGSFSTVNGSTKHTGTIGAIAAISFNGNKILTTGGGGAIITDSIELADKAKHLTTTAKVPHKWEFIHDSVAWNYRMPNINAALGLAQLRSLKETLVAKRQLAHAYHRAFKYIDHVQTLHEPDNCQSNYWLNTIRLSSDHKQHRDPLLDALNQAGLQSRPVWKPLHLLTHFAQCQHSAMDVTEDQAARLINIPSSASLVAEQGNVQA